MTKIADALILITGGASGIGKLMGLKALQKGARAIVIWDVNAAALAEVKETWAWQGYQVYTQVVDITNALAVEESAVEAKALAGIPDILMNNAGIVVGKPFLEHSVNDIEKTMTVNATGPMLVTRAFLPAMVARGSGHIVNIASAASLLPNPRMSVYAASKWALLGWSESLRLELEQLEKPLFVTSVTPGYIDTGMFAGVKAPLFTPILKPETMADAILKAVEKNRIILRKPSIVYLLPVLRGILPIRLFDLLAGRIFNVYNSMDRFTGRPQQITEKEQDLA